MNFPKRNKDLYALLKIETSAEEKKFIDFLIQNRVVDATSVCTNASCLKPYNNKLVFHKRSKEKNLFYRCNKCVSRWSARNNIFKMNDKSNLPITKIVELLWFWCKSPKYKMNEICS